MKLFWWIFKRDRITVIPSQVCACGIAPNCLFYTAWISAFISCACSKLFINIIWIYRVDWLACIPILAGVSSASSSLATSVVRSFLFPTSCHGLIAAWATGFGCNSAWAISTLSYRKVFNCDCIWWSMFTWNADIFKIPISNIIFHRDNVTFYWDFCVGNDVVTCTSRIFKRTSNVASPFSNLLKPSCESVLSYSISIFSIRNYFWIFNNSRRLLGNSSA